MALLSLLMLLGSMAGAQAAHPWLAITGPDGCLEPDPIALRVERLLRGGQPAPGTTIVLDVSGDTPSFSVLRDGEPSGRRAFPALVGPCDARLDTVAMAMALALESTGAAQILLPPSAAQPSEPPQEPSRPSRPKREVDPAAQTPGSSSVHGADVATPAAQPVTETPQPAATESSGAAARKKDTAAEAPQGAVAGAGPETRRTAAQPRAARLGTASPPPVDEQREPTTTADPLEVGAFGAFGIVLGVQPQLAVLVEAGALARVGSLTWEFSGLWSPPLATELAMGNGRARSSVVGGSVRACLGPAQRRFEWSACLGAVGGAMLGAGQGFDRDRRAASGWLAASAGARVGIPLHRAIGLGARVDGLLNLVRPGLRVQGSGGEDTRAALLGLRAQLVLTWTPP